MLQLICLPTKKEKQKNPKVQTEKMTSNKNSSKSSHFTNAIKSNL